MCIISDMYYDKNNHIKHKKNKSYVVNDIQNDQVRVSSMATRITVDIDIPM